MYTSQLLLEDEDDGQKRSMRWMESKAEAGGDVACRAVASSATRFSHLDHRPSETLQRCRRQCLSSDAD